MTAPLLDVEDLRVDFAGGHGAVAHALRGVSLRVEAGEVVCILGESGCGKSTAALSLMGLLPRMGHVVGGSIRLAGEDMVGLPERRLRDIRGRRVAMVFQNPATYLNAVLPIGFQIAEALHGRMPRRQAMEAARQALADVRIADPDRVMRSYPHQLSGGMNQRVLIAMAIVGRPELLVLDEPTTALDVTVQQEIITLLRDLRDRLGMGMLFITHDFGLAADIADRVYVMYAGRVVEQAEIRALFREPRHPYSRALVDSVLSVRERRERLHALPGAVPDLRRPIPGCAFATRCAKAMPRCAGEAPPVIRTGDGSAECWLYA